MRILILTQYFQPEPIFKGLPLAKALRERGHEVQVLTGFPNYPGGKVYNGYKVRAWQRETMEGIDVIRTPLYPSHNRSSIQRIINFVSFSLSSRLIGARLAKKPDVIYVYNLVTLGSTWRRLRRKHNAKVILDVQDLWPESIDSSGMIRSSILIRLLSWWCRREYLSPDRLFVLSPGFKQSLVERNIDESKIQVIYNWCDETAITVSVPNDTAAQKLGFQGKFNIVFAGTMGGIQALDCVIEAARIVENQLPEVQFTFIGGGTDLERLKSKSSTLANVQFLPPVPQSEIGEVLSNADVLLVHLKDDPVFQVTIPSKIQAYLYAGKPILCGVRGNAAALVEQAGAGFSFEPQNPSSLVDALIKLRRMAPSELGKMGRAGKKFYTDRLSFRAGVDQIEAAFESLKDET